MEVGCGVGNFIFPLLEAGGDKSVFIYACDFSKRAVQFVKVKLVISFWVQADQCLEKANLLDQNYSLINLKEVKLVLKEMFCFERNFDLFSFFLAFNNM